MLPILLPARQIEAAALVTVVFAAVARLLRGVSFSGAVAGAVVSFLLYAFVGPGAFIALVSVFAITWVATRLGYSKKQRIGRAESSEGRNGWQVLANLSVAAICAVLYPVLSKPAFLAGMAAALCEAAADTVSSELGQAWSHKARLITSWKEVPAGTDGGVSVAGTLAGLFAALFVASICVISGLLPLKVLPIVVLAGFGGAILDSFFGAWLELRGMLNNNQVNFLGTATAAMLGLLASGYFR